MPFNPAEIEPRWKQFWDANDTYRVALDTTKPKYYILDMFPYPSGAGLHVGHPLGYVASDILARAKRMEGYNVLHPMGFDSFGLPAEQYAIQTGIHPAEATRRNIATYRQQLDNLGFSFDWSRQVVTSQPEYYRWTQWIVAQLFGHYYNIAAACARPIADLAAHFAAHGSEGANAAGDAAPPFTAADWAAMTNRAQEDVLMRHRLVYRSTGYVNWCEALGTVLANDEVKEGVSERGGYPVVRREMSQWSLRITAYADRLLAGLESLEWSEALIAMQRNWIGRSEGASVRFEAATPNAAAITVFTTRPDTIFGATFLVVAPESEWLKTWLPNVVDSATREAVSEYLAYVASRSERDRLADKRVTGVFTGAYALHPFTGERVPIWTSEYVLAGYGTGAIMGVPSNDDRDRAFAEHNGLTITEVVDQSAFPDAALEDKVGTMQNSGFLDGLLVKAAITKAIDEIETRGLGTRRVNYKLRDANLSRQRYWGEPIPITERDGIAQALPLDALPVELPHLDDFKPTGTGASPLTKAEAWMRLDGETVRVTDTMPGFAGSSWYFLRFMDPHNTEAFAATEALEYWRDVDLYIGGTEHAVGHLLYARMWHKFLHDLGRVPTDEPFRRLVNQGMIQGRSLLLRFTRPNTDGSKQGETHVPIKYAAPDDTITDAAYRELQKADNRFAELPLECLTDRDAVAGKTQLHALVEKMSKSLLNVVNPDEVVAEYGADCFRMYEMFLGPITQSKPWDTAGIVGVEGFLRKYYALFYDRDNRFALSDDAPTREELRTLHHAIKRVRDDIERISLNTCVSMFMITVNELKKQGCNKRAILEPLNRLLAPFAPFLTEEIWHELGNTTSIHAAATLPNYEEEYLRTDTIDYPVQVNGKKRGVVTFPADLERADLEAAIIAHPDIQKLLVAAPLKKLVVVVGRMINLVV